MLAAPAEVPIKRIGTLAEDVAPVQFTVALANASTTDQTIVRVYAGLSVGVHDLTIPTGQLFAELPATADTLWPSGDAVYVQVLSSPAYEASDLAVSILVDQAGVSPFSQGPGLVTLADTKLRLGITGATSEEDSMVDFWISAFSQRIREYCGRYFNLSDYVQRQDAHGGPVSLLAGPVVSIDSVAVGGQSQDATLYRAAEDGAVYLQSGGSWVRWYATAATEIRYSAGWSPIPPDVQELVYMGMDRKWRGWGASRGLRGSQGPQKIVYPDGGSITYPTSVGDIMGAHDYLLGIPLGMLDGYRVGYGMPNNTELARV